MSNTRRMDNEAIYSRSLAYNRQLPIGGATGASLDREATKIPEGARLLENGNVLFSFYAPGAESVSVAVNGEDRPLSSGENGLWSAELTLPAGFNPMFFKVDGVEVVNSMAPIGFGWSKPINYVDVPGENSDFYLMRDVPHGSVVQEFYFSKVTGRYESCLTYLPPDYFTGDKTYPVLYLQHGHGENEQCWVHQGKVNFIADNLIADGKAVPCIIVMNNGMVQEGTDTDRHLNSELLERLLLEDCLPFIEGRYRVRTDSLGRGMAGLSMGSMQTSVTTMRHPELFSWVGIFSGFIRMFISKSEDNRHLELLDDRVRFESSFKLFFRAIGRGDNLIDFFNQDNEIITGKKMMPEDCAVHRMEYYEGGHDWNVWRMTIRDFLTLIFRD